jgi:hypothetical protein
VDKTQPMNVTVSSFNGQLESSIPVPPAPPESPTPPAPRAMTWRSWNFSLPAEMVPATPPAPETPSQTRMRTTRKVRVSYTSSDAPRAPELELESFGGIIQLASRAEIERALQLRQAMRDSADAVRRLSRLRTLRMHEHPRSAPDDQKPDENADKN